MTLREVMDLCKTLDKNSNLIVVLGIVLLIIISYSELIRKRSRMKLVVLKKAPLRKVRGIVFGRKGRKCIYSPAEDEGHVLICAGTGKGKTTTAITSLRQWGRQFKDEKQMRRTMYIVDISGDICSKTPKVGNKLVYEPENLKTLPYNIFGVVDAIQGENAKNEELEKLGFLLMPEPPNANENALFFLKGGRDILISSLIAFYHEGMDFTDICEKIADSSWKTLFREIDKTKNIYAIRYINSMDGWNEANIAGCFGKCAEVMKRFSNSEAVKNSIRRPADGEIAIEPKMLESHNVFVVISEDVLEVLAPILSIINSQVLQFIMKRKIVSDSPTILIMWDEFASLGISGNLVLSAVRRVRKRRCRILLLTQNAYSDLALLYGADATKSILSNFSFKCLLGGLGDPDSQKYFSELIGYKKEKKISTTKGHNSISRTQSESRELKIEPADLDRQGKKNLILIAPEEADGFFKLKKLPYYST